jgi:hypothetical protein
MAAGDSPTYVGTFYSRMNKDSWLYQPNFRRSRHRYRGHRESFKINLEINQMYTDLCNLDIKLTQGEDQLDQLVSNILEGVTHTGITYTDTDATPTDEEVILLSMNEFTANMAALKERIKRLENV